jgi:Copper type II ascorbate-dependent monooxygenase, C-terminal domain
VRTRHAGRRHADERLAETRHTSPVACRRQSRLTWLATALASLALVAGCAPGRTGPAANGAGSIATRAAPAGPRFVPPKAAPLRAGERFTTLTMTSAYTPSAPNGGTDEYRCFLVDPHLSASEFLTGSQFLPQNVAIVHHAIFFRVDPQGAAAARARDAGAPGAGWTCFGDAGIGAAASWVAHWAPGANETLLAPGLGFPMPPGSQLIMQIHYNLLATDGKPAGSDRSGIRLRLAAAGSHLIALQTMLLPAPVDLPCPRTESGPLCDRDAALADLVHRFGPSARSMVNGLAWLCAGGAAPPGSTQHCDHPVYRAGTIYALAGHMHLLGRSIRIDLNPGSARARVLLNVPVYDFDNQGIRPLRTPVTVRPGDVLRVTCTHDATLRGKLPQLDQLPPRYVLWGDGTSDEMCLGLVIWSPS